MRITNHALRRIQERTTLTKNDLSKLIEKIYTGDTLHKEPVKYDRVRYYVQIQGQEVAVIVCVFTKTIMTVTTKKCPILRLP